MLLVCKKTTEISTNVSYYILHRFCGPINVILVNNCFVLVELVVLLCIS